MQVDSFNPKHCTCRIQVQTEYWKEHLVKVLLYRSLQPYFCQSFAFIVLRYKFCYPWIPIPVLQDLSTGLKLAQEQEVTKDWRWPRNERQSSTCCRDFGIKEQESEGREVMLGMLLKLLVKEKLLHSGKVPMNMELKPEERRTRNRSSVIRHFERGDEDVTE